MQLLLVALGCLALAAAHPLVDPTQDTLVITKSDEASTEPEVSSTTEVTTEEPALPIKLTEMEVNSVVSLRYAHTAVVARVKNPARRAQEANFRVLLPETAFISGFIMTLDGKSYKAYVKEKEEAKQIYDDAVSHGMAAAHIQTKARDSNQFVVSVNVEPSSTAVFNLTYEELLVRRNGVYNHAINLHPGTLVPKLSVTVHIKESEKISDLRVPEIRTGNEIDATKDDAQNSKAVIERGHDDREATITFKPDLDEQKRLMDIYAQKSKESQSSQSSSHRWYSSQSEDDDKSTADGVLGQFVVQYDVDRAKDGEILVNEGYFVHFFAPTNLSPLGKYVVFVLDTSGSMMDHKIVQLREAMQAILSDLKPVDYFSIVEFASSVTVHSLKEAEQEPPKRTYYYSDYDKSPTLIPPSPATAENIDKAKVIISRLDASGGTNIHSALDVAVNLIHKRSEWGKKPAPAKSNDTVADAPTTEVATTEAFLPSDFDVEKMKSLEPIIIFLTDGDPTVGETNPTTIINRLTEKNFGEDKATIFSLAFGEDADRKFLRKLSLRNSGFMRHIYEAADAALQLRDFYRQVSSPLLAHVQFLYPNSQVKEDSLTKNKFRTFYAGSEVVVAGQLADDVTEITPEVLAFCGVEDGVGKKRFEKRPKVPVPAKRQEYLPLERLWSYLTIKQLLDQKDAADTDDDKDGSPKKKALALALKYEFVTPLTSLVVVKPNATKAVDAESVDKPNKQESVLVPSSPQVAPEQDRRSRGRTQSRKIYAAPVQEPVSVPSGPPVASKRGPSRNRGRAKSRMAITSPILDSPSLAYGAPLSFNRHPVSSSSFYASAAGAAGFSGAPAPSFASNAFSGDSLTLEESEDYEYNDNKAIQAYPSMIKISQRSDIMPATYSLFADTRHRFDNFGAGLTGSSPVFDSAPWSDYGSSTDSDETRVEDRSDFRIDVALPGTPLVSNGPPSTTVPPPPSSTATPAAAPAPAAAVYHLEMFSWAEPLVNATADGLLLQVNGTDVFLKLTKDTEVPKVAEGDVACASSVKGTAGLCVYLTRCEAAHSITADLYASTYCDVNGYAGVCCNPSDVDKPSPAAVA